MVRASDDTDVFLYSQQHDVENKCISSMRTNTLLLGVCKRPFRSILDMAAAILATAEEPTLLRLLLAGAVIFSVGDFHKYNMWYRILAQPYTSLIDILREADTEKLRADVSAARQADLAAALTVYVNFWLCFPDDYF
jgi:hypothetical protein